MIKQDPVTFNPRINSEEGTNYQVGQVGSFKIAFRTMSRDLEFLNAKQGALPPLEELKTKAINISSEKEEKIIEIKKDKKSPLPQTTASIYKEAKKLYQQKTYDEASEKFIEVLNIKPSHWRAKWYLGKTKKKIQQAQTQKIKTGTELTAEKENLAEKLKQEKEKQKEIIAKLKAEARAKEEAEARAKIEADARDKIGKELELIEQEKTSAIAQTQEIQAEAEQIKKEAEEKVKQEFAKKLESEEIQIKQEQETRRQLEKELLSVQKEKKEMEQEIEKEREELLSSQKAITEQLSSINKTIIPAYESPRQPLPETPPSFWQETQIKQSPAPIYSPSPIIPITETAEISPSRFVEFFSLAKSFFLSKTAKIIGLVLSIGLAGTGLMYFTGLYKVISSQKQEAPTQVSIQEAILPTALFPVSRTETIELKAGQKKNLFQEINRLAEKNQTAGTFTRVLVKFTNEDQQQKYASLTDLIDALQIIFPAEILANLENNYTLFFYSQQELPDSPFLASLGENKLGLAITFEDSEKIGQQFINWEKNMPVDLDALFLGKKISFSSAYQFQEISYGDITIHSLGLPNQYSSLNYFFAGNKAIITTSDESARELIDRLGSSQ